MNEYEMINALLEHMNTLVMRGTIDTMQYLELYDTLTE